ncbi:MAG TPA: hypothetical protein VM347_06495 [Nonomuraea sp.]|nr:hypothetical protein [Nonomuraea sp.]
MTAHLESPTPVTGGGPSAAESCPHDGAGTLPGSALPTSQARRLAVGYIRLRPDTDDDSGEQLTARLSAFAHRSGLTLTDIYTEPLHVFRRSAFGALIEALRRPEICAVVAPSPEHLSEFDGIYQAMRTLIELETCAEVVIMSDNGAGS